MSYAPFREDAHGAGGLNAQRTVGEPLQRHGRRLAVRTRPIDFVAAHLRQPRERRRIEDVADVEARAL